MASKLVTVATFGEAIKAQLCRAKLTASGIRSFLPDEHVSTLNPHYMAASSGIRVQVRQEDAARAMDVLRAASEAPEGEEDEEPEDAPEDGPRCPECGAQYSYFEWSPMERLFIVLLAGLPLLFMEKKWHCRRCEHAWRVEAKEGRVDSPYRRPRRTSLR